MRKHAKHSHAHVNSFLMAQKCFLCAFKIVYIVFISLFFILATLSV